MAMTHRLDSVALPHWLRRLPGLSERLPSDPCVRQYDEEDCGAACLATVCQTHGERLPLSFIRHRVGTSSQGTTLLGLKRGAESLGFHARAAKADAALLDDLASLPLPMICHWHGCHWVVLHGWRGNQLLVADPAVGLRLLSREAFLVSWSNGVLLALEPDPSRFPAVDGANEGWRSGKGLGAFLPYVLPFKQLLLKALVLNLVIGVLALGMPLLMQILTDDVLVRGDGEMLRTLAIGILMLFMLRALLSLLQGLLVGHFGQKLQLQMVLHYGQHLLRLPLSYFESRRSGEVVSRLDDIQKLNQLISNLALGLPGQFCIALISLGLMVQYSVSLTLAALLGYALVIGCQLAVLPALQNLTYKHRQ